MIHVELDEQTGKAKLDIEGSLGGIYAEIGLVILNIANNKDVEMTVDDVIAMVKEAIEENTR